jgi:hypothetical protein
LKRKDYNIGAAVSCRVVDARLPEPPIAPDPGPIAPLRPGTQAGIVAVILGGLALGFALHPVARFGDTSLALFGLPLPQICWFRLTTGLPCASCGVTRAVVLLLHGRLQDSWAAHQFGVPVFALILAALPPRVAGALGRRRPWVPRWDRAWGWAVAGTLLAMLLWWWARVVVVWRAGGSL